VLAAGIGKALAIKFARKGWNVAVSARRENLLNELKELNPKYSSISTLDVTKIEDCKIVSKMI
jgi:NADP-dependent 3-hydroxy acid dehydrogenase YdfG